MSDTTLSSITLDVLGQYHQAGQHLVRACQGGGERLVRGVQARTGKIFGGKVRQQEVADLMLRGLESAANTAAKAMAEIAQRSAAGIQRVGEATDRVEERLQAAGLGTVGAFHRSAAAASLQIAGKVSELTQRLSDRLACDEAVEQNTPRRAAKAPKAAPRKRMRRTRQA